MKSSAATVKRPYEADHADNSWLDSIAFKAYVLRIAAIIKAADKNDYPNYKGVTCRYLNDEMGADVNREWTGAALRSLGVYRNGQVPERYTFRVPPVRVIPKSEWGTLPKPQQGYQFDGRCFPERGIYGKRDK